jgi:hypothetical protein
MADEGFNVSVWRRGRVVFTTAALLSFLVLLMHHGFVTNPGGGGAEGWFLLVAPALGPFVGLFGPYIGYEADSFGECVLVAIPVLLACAAHPVRPGWVTGVVSVGGVFVWVVLGLAYINQGC